MFTRNNSGDAEPACQSSQNVGGRRTLVSSPKRRHVCSRSLRSLAAVAIVLLLAASGRAGEDPFLTTYTHQMEEPGNLEVGTKLVSGKPGKRDRFLGVAAEFEYSLSRWWMTEVYLDGQATSSQSVLFTGYRWENRFRLFPHEHWINPLLYVEFGNTNGADKTLLEVVGHDGNQNLIEPNGSAHREKNREFEAKLILGSSFKGWTIAENIIAEKSVRHLPFEFGYTVGASRPLVLAAKPNRCNFCTQNIQVGVEIYGGLGTHADFGLSGTSHYVAPVVAWTIANGTTFRVSPGFGVTDASASFLLKFGVSYGIDNFGRSMRSLFHSRASTSTSEPVRSAGL